MLDVSGSGKTCSVAELKKDCLETWKMLLSVRKSVLGCADFSSRNDAPRFYIHLSLSPSSRLTAMRTAMTSPCITLQHHLRMVASR